MTRPFVGAARILLQAIVAVVGAGLLAVSAMLVVFTDAGSSDALWVALRVAALVAVTLIFTNICVGAFRPFFVRVFKGRTVQRVHVLLDLTGFVVALGHGLMAFVFGIAGYTTAAVWIGPIALVVLVVVIITALTRRWLRRSWRWVHRLNYLFFAAVMVHGLTLGYDLRHQVLAKAWLGLLGAVVVVGFAYRIVGGLIARRGRRAGA